MAIIGAKARELSRGQRRLLVLTEYAGLLSYPTASILAGDSWWLFLGFLGFVAAVLIHHRHLLRFTQKIANKEDSELDERQTAVRNDAHRTAYQILGAVIIIVLALLQILTIGPLGERLWTPQISVDSVVMLLFATFVWMFVTLPTSVIAWTEPDPGE